MLHINLISTYIHFIMNNVLNLEFHCIMILHINCSNLVCIQVEITYIQLDLIEYMSKCSLVISYSRNMKHKSLLLMMSQSNDKYQQYFCSNFKMFIELYMNLRSKFLTFNSIHTSKYLIC